MASKWITRSYINENTRLEYYRIVTKHVRDDNQTSQSNGFPVHQRVVGASEIVGDAHRIVQVNSCDFIVFSSAQDFAHESAKLTVSPVRSPSILLAEKIYSGASP